MIVFAKSLIVLAFLLGSVSSFAPSVQAELKYKLSWEPEAETRIRELHTTKKESESPLMIGVVGIPGSGKSTCVEFLGRSLADTGCMIFPHDGYHYSLEDLKKLPHADDAIYRRGAPDTFNAESLYEDLLRIRNGKDELIPLPGFDHARGDPEADAHVFNRGQHKVVMCEGLYLLHDQDGWDKIANLFDLTIFLDADVDKCMDRVKIRNQCIPGYTPEEIAFRVDAVDRVNAMTVVRSKERAQVVYRTVAF